MSDVPAPIPAPAAAPEISPEFFLRVNDFIEMANRIERRLSSHHAQLAMLHGFSRYSAHHYRASAKSDDADSRDAFADYIGGAVKQLVREHIEDISGPVVAAGAAIDPPTE